jgi:hypothetical protein
MCASEILFNLYFDSKQSALQLSDVHMVVAMT